MVRTDVVEMVCGVCGEPVVKRSEPFPREGWALAVVDATRLEWQHTDGEPLCPAVVVGDYAPARPTSKWVTVCRVTYDPWEEGQDEPVRNGEDVVVWPVDPDDEDTTAVEHAVNIMKYVIEASNWPWQPGSWYVEETYIHPYTGEREEVSHHLTGYTDEEQAEIWAAIKSGV